MRPRVDSRSNDEARLPDHALLMRPPSGDAAQDPIESEPLQTEGHAHDRLVFEAGTVTEMFLIEVVATLGSDHRLTDDEITNMIETVVDELDRLPLEPSVGTVRVGDNIEMTVSVTVDEPEEWDALAYGVSAMKSAFHAAGITTAGLVAPQDLRSHVTPLLPA
jgi:hypothetical protein